MNRFIRFFLLITILGIISSCKEDSNELSGTFVDLRDNHKYKWVKIDDQVWMAENLAFLPKVNPPADGDSNNPYYYVYDYKGNDVNAAKSTENYKILGVLYNWQAALEVCPKGWHLPSDKEWLQLAEYINDDKGPFITNEYDFYDSYPFIGWESEGKYLKATDYWNNNGNGTDDFGFSALPGGIRYTDGYFHFIGDEGYWLSSTTQNNSYNIWSRKLIESSSFFYKVSYTPDIGYSIRCVKD